MCKFPFMAAIGLASVVSSGCGSSSPTVPTTASLRGEWGGTTCAPSYINSCVIVLRLDQSGTALSGTWGRTAGNGPLTGTVSGRDVVLNRSEEHTSELQSQSNLVCRLLLEKKKK